MGPGNRDILPTMNEQGDKGMPKKIFALIPSEREKECDHPLGFAYTGKIPCTGPRVCRLCGTRAPEPEPLTHDEIREVGNRVSEACDRTFVFLRNLVNLEEERTMEILKGGPLTDKERQYARVAADRQIGRQACNSSTGDVIR